MAPKSFAHPFAKTVKPFKTASGKSGRLYSLPALANQFPNVKRLPHSLRIVLETCPDGLHLQSAGRIGWLTVSPTPAQVTTLDQAGVAAWACSAWASQRSGVNTWAGGKPYSAARVGSCWIQKSSSGCGPSTGTPM